MDNHESRPLLTTAHVAGWKARVIEIEHRIAELEAERHELRSLIAMAHQLAERASKLPDVEPSVSAASGRQTTTPLTFAFENVAAKAVNYGHVITAESKFPDAVLSIVGRRPSGITFAQLRSEVEASPLGERLRQSDKAFYHATSRLRSPHRNSPIVEYRGYLFTSENFRTFKERVSKGVEVDKPLTVSGRRGSPMTNKILEVVSKNPGIIAKDIVQKLREEGVLSNENSAFNAILRMRQKEELSGGGPGDRGITLGPKAPEFDHDEQILTNADHIKTATDQ